MSKNRFHRSKIKHCNCSRTILTQLCSINHYWLSFLRSHVPTAKHQQLALDMHACMQTQRTNIIQEIPASQLESYAEMLSLYLNTNHSQDIWFCSQDQICIQPTYNPTGTCIECLLCLQDLKTIPTYINYLTVAMELLAHNSDVSHMGKTLYVHLAVLA